MRSQITVFDAETMQPIGFWPVGRAGPLALDRTGRVCMLARRSDSASARLVRFNSQGEQQAPELTFPSDVVPIAFCFASDGRVLVADDGPAQQIRIYSLQGSEFRETGTFGERGGIGSGTPGAFGDRKFNQVTAIGCDAADKSGGGAGWPEGGGGTVLESYRLADGKLNWRLLWPDVVDMGDVDAASDADVFTKEEHFRLDYTQPPVARPAMPASPSDEKSIRRMRGCTSWSGGAWVRQIAGRRNPLRE